MSRLVFRLPERDRTLLLAHYEFYRALATGARTPTTEAQEHFVAVCRGQAEPVTEHEQAYASLMKLLSLTTMPERKVVEYGFALQVPVDDESAGPQTSPSVPRVAPDVDLSQFDEFGEGVP